MGTTGLRVRRNPETSFGKITTALPQLESKNAAIDRQYIGLISVLVQNNNTPLIHLESDGTQDEMTNELNSIAMSQQLVIFA